MLPLGAAISRSPTESSARSATHFRGVTPQGLFQEIAPPSGIFCSGVQTPNKDVGNA